jgi:hypothetical protein
MAMTSSSLSIQRTLSCLGLQPFANDAGALPAVHPATSPRDHLQPANGRHFRLKLMVKRRHKPISDSEISIADDGLSLSAAEWLMPTVS